MSSRRPVSNLEGAVSLEFMIAFPSIWVFCLCVFQLVLLARADIMVRHASDAAARSAAVVLADDPARYGGEPEMSVSREPTSRRASRDGHDNAAGRRLPVPSLGGRSRRETILAAARVPLLSLSSPELAGASKPTMERALGSGRLRDVLNGVGPTVRLSFADVEEERVQGPEVTVEVSYLHTCLVPIARHLLCKGGSAVGGHGGRVWPFTHSTTSLIHDAPYDYRERQRS